MQDEAAMSFRLSPQQEFAWSIYPDGPNDGGQVVVGIDGPLEVERLREALLSVVDRHEILRTTFQRRPGMKTPLQVVRDSAAPDWELLDITHLDPQDQRARLAEVAETERSRRWDYDAGPLLAARLLGFASDRSALVLSIAAPCADGGSLATIVAELAAQYDGRPSAQDPLQYADFAEWQNHLVATDDEEAEAGRQFWLEEGGAAHTLLPFMRPVPPEATETVDVPAAVDLPALLEALARDNGTTPTALVQAVWAIVLWKVTGENDVVFGSMSSRRLHAELDAAVGSFARPLPLRVHLNGDLSVGDVAAQLQRSEELAARWQDYLPLDAGSNGIGFVDTRMFEPIPAGHVTMSCLALAPSAVFSVALEWDGRGGRLRHDPAALDRASAERTARQIGNVLAAIAAAPTSRIEEIGLLDAAEVRRLTVEVNNTAAAVQGVAVHELFSAAAVAAGGRDAVVDEAGHLSYAELDSRSSQLAHHLKRVGIGPDRVVGLCTDRSRDMLVGLLGILKTGGAYLPLNFEHPPARLAHQLRETHASVVVTQESLLEFLPAFDGDIFCLDRDRAALENEPTTSPVTTVSPDDLAYVIYTSGSTGTPKGVGVTNGNLANYVHSITRLLRADTEPLAFGMVTALSTDLGNTAVFPALCSGGTLVLVGPATAADSAAAAAYLRANPVDVLKITPSHLNALLAGGDGADVLPKRWLILGGEALSWDIVARVRELSECQILNHYGPTETTIGSCVFLVEDARQRPVDRHGSSRLADRQYRLLRAGRERRSPCPRVWSESCSSPAPVSHWGMSDAPTSPSSVSSLIRSRTIGVCTPPAIWCVVSRMGPSNSSAVATTS